MPKFTIFKTPRYCPNARDIGHDKHSVEVGDLIVYQHGYGEEERPAAHRQFARVLGLAAGPLPDGSDPGRDTLVVLAADEMLTHAYERYVKLSDVVRVRAPSKSAFAQWFLQGPPPHPEVAIAAVRYGCVNDSYIDKHLQDGELRKSFRDADKVG